MYEFAALGAVVMAAAFLQGLTGFGFALVALPLLDLFLEMQTIVPLMGLLGVCMTTVLAVQLRRFVRLGAVAALMAATLPCIPLGVYGLTHIPSHWLALALGAVMVLFTAHRYAAKPTPRQLGLVPTLAAGALSGLLSGGIGAGGPPVIVYTAMQPWSKDEAKGTLSCYFTLSAVIAIASFAASGLVTREVLVLFPSLLPFLLLGLLLGAKAYARISDANYKQMVLALVFVLGWVMLFRNFPA